MVGRASQVGDVEAVSLAVLAVEEGGVMVGGGWGWGGWSRQIGGTIINIDQL